MAFNIRRIDPLDLQPRKAIGVSLPLSGKAVFNSTYQTKDAIKTNIINYFLTGVGERYLNPTFGAPLRNLLFENINQETITRVEEEVRRGLVEYFPRVVPTELNVQAEPDRNTVTLALRYAISDTNIEDDLVINFES